MSMRETVKRSGIVPDQATIELVRHFVAGKLLNLRGATRSDRIVNKKWQEIAHRDAVAVTNIINELYEISKEDTK